MQQLDSSVWTLFSSAIWYSPRADEWNLGPAGESVPFQPGCGKPDYILGEAQEALGTYA